MKSSRLVAASALVLMVTGGLVACAPPQKDDDGARTSSGGKASEASSAADFGGMDGLVEAAKKEGELNVIALPPDWANYGAIIKAFSDKYGIAVNSMQPDANSQEEINTAVQQKGKSTAPDVFDLGQTVALANMSVFSPYKVEKFDDVSETFKDPNGKWINDYGGFMSIGYDSSKVPDITSVDDLMKPEFKGKVALNGDPTQAAAGFSGVMMTAISQGGSPDDIAPGVDFFRKLNEAGNFLPVDPTPATIESGETPVVLDWDYLNVAENKKLPSWRVVIPPNAAVAGYYYQAINTDAPHPAAARLWEEFLFGDEGQNLYLHGGARPVRANTMVVAGTIDLEAYRLLPPVDGGATFVSEAQNQAAKKYLEANWAKAVG
jgi:putative spermidine/putrescine transport system substrate-binding protein